MRRSTSYSSSSCSSSPLSSATQPPRGSGNGWRSRSKQEALKERVAMQLAQKRAADAHAAECAARDRDARLLLVRILKAKASLSNAF